MIYEIKYVRPCGNKPIGNGTANWKGGCLNEMRLNENTFISNIKEGVSDEQLGFSKYKGGMIVFSINANSVFQDQSFIKRKVLSFYNTLINRIFKNKKLTNIVTDINDQFKNSEYKDTLVSGISIGKFFKGRYIDIKTKEKFDETSTTVEFGGIPSELLLLLATKICQEFKQQTVLVKDFNTDKIYYADDSGFEGSTDDEIISSIRKELNKTKLVNQVLTEIKETFK